MRAIRFPPLRRLCLSALSGAGLLLASFAAVAGDPAPAPPPRPLLRLSEVARRYDATGGMRRRSRLAVRIPVGAADERAMRAGGGMRIRVGAWDLDLAPSRDSRFAAGRRRARLPLWTGTGELAGTARVCCRRGAMEVRVSCRDVAALAEERVHGPDGFFVDLRTAECELDGRVIPIAVAITGFVDWLPDTRVSLEAKGFASAEELRTPFVAVASPREGREFDGRLRGYAVAVGEAPLLSSSVDGAEAVPFEPGEWISVPLGGATVRLFPFDALLDATGGSHVVAADARMVDGAVGRREARFEMPVPVPLGDLDAGSHVLEVRDGGAVWAWDGYNYYGELGVTAYLQPMCPVPVPRLGGIRAVHAGNSQSLAVDDTGQVWRWGLIEERYDAYGTFLDYTQTSAPIPVPNLLGVVDVAAGYGFVHALKADGTVWGWGRNDDGQLLDGTETWRKEPVRLRGLERIEEIRPCLALRRDGTVWVWGPESRRFGGDGTSPVQVPGLPRIRTIDGSEFCVALAEDGTVWQWGGYAGYPEFPYRVPGLESVTAISASESGEGMALLADGTVWTWDGGTVNEGGDPARRVPGLTGVRRIAAGYSFFLAESGTGALWVWGEDFLRTFTSAYHVPEPVLAPREYTGEYVPAHYGSGYLLLSSSGEGPSRSPRRLRGTGSGR